MGSSAWSSGAASSFTRSNSTKSTNQVFTQNTAKQVAAAMSPKGITFREARKSAAHPLPLGLMIWLDITGSMGEIPEYLVKNSFPTIMDVIIKHGTEHPQILFGAIGDKNDQAPLQVGQFEAGAAELNTCLSSTWLEGNGQGNGEEAYLLAWLVAARHTSMDNFEERGEKGILFTVGDEKSHTKLSAAYLKDLMGYAEATDITDEEILKEAQRSFEIFHIHVNHGGNYDTSNSSGKEVIAYWRKLLGERAIVLEDKDKLAELIGTTVAMIHGANLQDVTKTFDGHTADVVSKALAHVAGGSLKRVNQTDGVVKL